MGYYTSYSLSMTKDPSKGEFLQEEMLAVIEDLRSDNESAEWALTKEGATNEEATWYEWNEDMIEFSKKYPDYLFELNGSGETDEDVWRNYYYNGNSQVSERFVFYSLPNGEELQLPGPWRLQFESVEKNQ